MSSSVSRKLLDGADLMTDGLGKTVAASRARLPRGLDRQRRRSIPQGDGRLPESAVLAGSDRVDGEAGGRDEDDHLRHSLRPTDTPPAAEAHLRQKWLQQRSCGGRICLHPVSRRDRAGERSRSFVRRRGTRARHQGVCRPAGLDPAFLWIRMLHPRRFTTCGSESERTHRMAEHLDRCTAAAEGDTRAPADEPTTSLKAESAYGRKRA
jgi:hypothetical protein